MISHSLWLHDHIFFQCLHFPIVHLDFSMGIFFFSRGIVSPRNVFVFPYTNPKGTCPCALLNSFTIFLPPLCLVLADNLFYSRQSPSPLQLSLLILLHCRASFSLPPPLERRGRNISVNAGILYGRWNDISIQCIQTDML